MRMLKMILWKTKIARKADVTPIPWGLMRNSLHKSLVFRTIYASRIRKRSRILDTIIKRCSWKGIRPSIFIFMDALNDWMSHKFKSLHFIFLQAFSWPANQIFIWIDNQSTCYFFFLKMWYLYTRKLRENIIAAVNISMCWKSHRDRPSIVEQYNVLNVNFAYIRNILKLRISNIYLNTLMDYKSYHISVITFHITSFTVFYIREYD